MIYIPQNNRNKMKYYTLLLLAFFALIIPSCTDEGVESGEGTLELIFKPTYDGDVLIIDTIYDYEQNRRVKFDEVNFFISNVQLEKTNSDVVQSEEVKLVEYSDVDEFSEANEGVSIDYKIPSGAYSNLSLGIGLTPELNATSPADYASGDLLADDNFYWFGWQSYIFVRIQARFDMDGDGTFTDKVILYHLGGDEAFRTKEFNESFTIQAEQIKTLNLTFDLKDILRDENGEMLDPIEFPSTHTEADSVLTNLVMDNFQDQIIINE